MLQQTVRCLIGGLLILCLWICGGASALADDLPPQADLNLADLSIRDLGSVDEAGAIPESLNAEAGWDVARTWSEGTPLDEVLKLGDLTDLSPQAWAEYQISSVSGISLEAVSLDNFPLITEQALRDLAQIIPNLSGFQIQDIPPLNALLAQQTIPGLSANVEDLTFGNVLQSVPEIGGLRLADLDPAVLSGFSLLDVPNASITPLESFSGWKKTFFSEIPGLSQVPLGQFPNPLSLLSGVVARVDMVYGPTEARRQNTITGGDQVGFQVSCAAECAYVELDEVPELGRDSRSALRGKQFISGKYQAVEGGFGSLKYWPSAFNIPGEEPTGRLPFGSAFKLVIWEPDETTDTVSSYLYFRVCGFSGGCTPYNQFRVPFLDYKVNDPMFIGLLDGQGGATTDPALTTNRERAVAQAASKQYSGGANSYRPCTGEVLNGVSLDSLSGAIAQIESQGSGGNKAVGIYTCADGGRNCGRALGRYQTMSYKEPVAAEVAKVDGGRAWLKRIREGYRPSAAEMMQYYPPEAQERVFQAEMKTLIGQAQQQIDPKTGQAFAGDRLLERVAQMWFGGPGSAVDGGKSDGLGKLSVYGYGVKARENYLAKGGTSTQCTALSGGEGPVGQASGELRNAVAGSYRVSSEFGWRTHPIHGDRRFHTGIDQAAPTGTPVVAADGGVVTFAGIGGSLSTGYGRMVIVDHGDGRTTRYAHLNDVTIQEGQPVALGQQIGTVGSTGGSTGPHLHFEVRENGNPVNPRQYINF